ncbi:MAG: cell wall hydrolase [Caulobacteraceae bacterium]|nr:cell wall hydrolase [Caulobacteraceae bacterium]
MPALPPPASWMMLDPAPQVAPAPAPAAFAPVRALAGLGATGLGDLQCLTQAVYYEARGESEAGQAAVAQVVINRVGRAPYPGTVCGVVYQANARTCQFTFVCDGAMRRPREPSAWERARMVAERALAGHVEPIVERATSYHTVALGGIWGSRMVQIAQIGNHSFYTPAAGQVSGPARRSATLGFSHRSANPASPPPARYTFALGLLTQVSPAPVAPPSDGS